MRSGTGPSEPCEIANFDPIHARAARLRFSDPYLRLIYRARSRLGMRSAFPSPLFLLLSSLFFFAFHRLLAQPSASLLETMTRAKTGIAPSRRASYYLHSADRTFSFSSCNRDIRACFAAICQRGIAPCWPKIERRMLRRRGTKGAVARENIVHSISCFSNITLWGW